MWKLQNATSNLWIIFFAHAPTTISWEIDLSYIFELSNFQSIPQLLSARKCAHASTLFHSGLRIQVRNILNEFTKPKKEWNLENQFWALSDRAKSGLLNTANCDQNNYLQLYGYVTNLHFMEYLLLWVNILINEECVQNELKVAPSDIKVDTCGLTKNKQCQILH